MSGIDDIASSEGHGLGEEQAPVGPPPGPVLIAVDQSEESEMAFDCTFFFQNLLKDVFVLFSISI